MKVHQKRLLDEGKIVELVGALRSIDSANPANPELAEKIRIEADVEMSGPIKKGSAPPTSGQ